MLSLFDWFKPSTKKPTKPTLDIDFLKPKSSPEKLYLRLIRWLLSTGRFIVVAVEIIVLVAFISRFKLDADIASTKEAVEQQIPFIESLKADETLIRQTQAQLITIKEVVLNSPDYVTNLQTIAQQTPLGVSLININLERNAGQLTLKLSGQAQSNQDLTTLVTGLKETEGFSNVAVSSVSLERDTIVFSITGFVNIQGSQERQL